MQLIAKYITFFLLLSFQAIGQNYTFDLTTENLQVLSYFRYQKIEAPLQKNVPNNTEWKAYNIFEHPSLDLGSFWLETELNIIGSHRESDVIAIKIDGLGSRYQIYWDNEVIGFNGDIDSLPHPDIAFNTFYLSQSQTSAGKHNLRILLHIDNPKFSWYDNSIVFGYYSNILNGRDEYYAFQLGTAGVYITAALICLALFWGGSRHRGYLIFAAISLISAFRFLEFPIIDYLDLSTIIFWKVIHLDHLLRTVFWILIAMFVLVVFKIPKIKILLPILVLISILPHFFELTYSYYVFRYYFISLLLLSGLINSIYKHIRGSISALIGTTILLLPLEDIFAGIQLPQYVESAPDILFVFFIILAMSQQVREDYRLHEEALRITHNLEKELLRKNIQPHFLMNTLQSIKSYIREKPDAAIEFIQALAEEFRLINKIALESMIPVSTEVELCRSHLKLMSFRKEVEYTLNTRISSPEERIPPMIFHTLIENGLTHAFEIGESGCFNIEQSVEFDVIKYSISNNGGRLKTLENKSKDEIEEGLGLKYVRSRLEENISGKYDFDYSFDDTLWQINISIKR
ncbi:MAG: histidine kinase [Bacteroidetes bacterium]|nr:histidine kinase [Bacteroidota bacterium]